MTVHGLSCSIGELWQLHFIQMEELKEVVLVIHCIWTDVTISVQTMGTACYNMTSTSWGTELSTDIRVTLPTVRSKY